MIFPFRHIRRLSVALLLLLVLSPAISAGEPALTDGGAGASQAFAITGKIRVATCDSTSCTMSIDCTGWKWTEWTLGPFGISPPPRLKEGVGFAEIAFDLPAVPDFVKPTLLLLHPADVEEITVNGIAIPGPGSIGEHPVLPPEGPRLHNIPKGVLRTGANSISIRFLLTDRNPDFLNNGIVVGENDLLSESVRPQREQSIAFDAAFLSFLLVQGVVFVLLTLLGVVRGEYILFPLFVAVYGAEFVLSSHLLDSFGTASSAFLSHAIAPLRSGAVVPMLFLVRSATGNRRDFFFPLLVTVAVAFFAVDLLAPPLSVIVRFGFAKKVFLGIVGLYYVYLAARAALKRSDDAVPILIGVTIFAIFSRLEIYLGISLRDFGTGALSLSLLYSLAARHARLKERVIDSSRRLLVAHEEERRRIARDIHDSVGQSLAALKLRIQMIASRAGKNGSIPAESLDAASTAASDAIEEVRRVARDLRPVFTESMTFPEAVEWLAASFGEAHRLRVTVSVGAMRSTDLPPSIKDHLFRVLQEALTNASRHARANRADISLHEEGGRFVLRISDDGIGFDPSKETSGIGLRSMTERAELLCGRFLVDSSPGKGTTITMEVPLP